MIEVGSRKTEVGRARIFFIFVALLVFASTAYADKIWLKNGKVYEGKITGKSDRRYLFSLNIDGENFPISFFIDQIEKVELSKDTVATQIPYLKDVESMKVPVKEESSKIYEFSLYNKNQNDAMAADLPFTEADIRKLLSKDEWEYYQRYNQVIQRYADKLVEVQDIYANLVSATKADFARARQTMDELYYELNDIPAPLAFKAYHGNYLDSVKAMYLAFSALDRGQLDAASHQIKISDEAKARSINLFRELISSRRSQAKTPEKTS